jgi:alkylation response protein AidB-like acyl-CoA dehydrogenase
MLADWQLRLRLHRALLYATCENWADVILMFRATKYSAKCQSYYCTEVANEVTTDAVQILWWILDIMKEISNGKKNDEIAKITQIYEGNKSRIQRIEIG